MSPETQTLAENMGRRDAQSAQLCKLPQGEFAELYLASYNRSLAENVGRLPPREYPLYNKRGRIAPSGRVFRNSTARN
jgi:hypothetical protein